MIEMHLGGCTNQITAEALNELYTRRSGEHNHQFQNLSAFSIFSFRIHQHGEYDSHFYFWKKSVSPTRCIKSKGYRPYLPKLWWGNAHP
jgi:hypothetical protein